MFIRWLIVNTIKTAMLNNIGNINVNIVCYTDDIGFIAETEDDL